MKQIKVTDTSGRDLQFLPHTVIGYKTKEYISGATSLCIDLMDGRRIYTRTYTESEFDKIMG